MGRFRILSLDGGGIKGTFTAAVLAELERMTGKRVADYFDLITGTSTGGIIAIALGMEVPAADLLAFYEERGPEIFPLLGPRAGAIRNVRWWARRPKFSVAPLRRALESVLGARRLGESKHRLVIPSYNAVNGQVTTFKTAHHERFKQDYRDPAVDAALATSAAPTYFPTFCPPSGLAFIDGGVWANSPVMVGITEALGWLDRPLAEVEVLSIGTTDEPCSLDTRQRQGGIAAWNTNLLSIPFQAQAAGAVAMARVLLRDRFVRINATTRPGRFTLDDASRIAELKGLGVAEARHMEDRVSRRFLDAQADPFEPIYPCPVAPRPVAGPLMGSLA